VTSPDLLKVLREHGDLLQRMASGYERQRSDRDDLVQEMAIAVWKALPRYRGEGALRGFVAKVAQFAALERLRSKPQASDGDEAIADAPSPEPSPEHGAEAAQRIRALRDAVAALPTGQRECVLLALEGFGNREIAALLGIPDNTVDQRLSRARTALRARLEHTDAR
jgi:RNA polymerase sigma factor (sigma-70 family)